MRWVLGIGTRVSFTRVSGIVGPGHWTTPSFLADPEADPGGDGWRGVCGRKRRGVFR
jgi:hypothetical protein